MGTLPDRKPTQCRRQYRHSEAALATADRLRLLIGSKRQPRLRISTSYPSMSFDPETSFEPVMLVSSFPMVLLTCRLVADDNLSDLLAEAKAKPDSVNVALPSTTARLVLELLNLQGGVSFRGIPYKGSGTSMTDLIGGQRFRWPSTRSARPVPSLQAAS